MSRTKKFLYNSSAAAIQQIVVALIGFIIPMIMIRHYGSEINGLISSINQFIALFRLVEAGLSGAAVYALYKPIADNNVKGINSIVSASKKFYIQIGYIFISIVIGFACFYPFLVNAEMLTPYSIGLLVMILGANGALEFFTLAKYRIILTADQRNYVVSIATIVQIVLNALIIIILARLQVHIVLVQALALLSIFVRTIILMVYVNKKYKFLDFNVQPNMKALDKRWDALYLQLLGFVQAGMPIILATLFTSLKNVSVFTIYNMVFVAISGILSIFISGLSATFGNVIARGEKSVLQKAYKEFELLYYSIITVVYSVTLLTIMPFIRLYTQGVVDVNYDLPLLGFLFVLNGWLYNLKTPQGMLVISAGLYKETRIQSTIQALIILILGLILTPMYWLYGIIIASCLSNLYRVIDLFYFIPKHVTQLSVKGTVYRVFRMSLLCLIIWKTFPFKGMQIENFFEWFIFASLIGIYSTILVALSCITFDRRDFTALIKRLKIILVK